MQESPQTQLLVGYLTALAGSVVLDLSAGYPTLAGELVTLALLALSDYMMIPLNICIV
jgi:hypothetical protein